MTVLEQLKKYIGRYQGEGKNHENEEFVASFSLEEILSGRGFQIQFTAKSSKHEYTIFHSEISTVAPNVKGGISLYNLNTNMPFLCEHLLVSEDKEADLQSFVFRFGETNNPATFREEIRLDCFQDGSLGYHYSWGMPGADFAYRSGAKVKKVTVVTREQ